MNIPSMPLHDFGNFGGFPGPPAAGPHEQLSASILKTISKALLENCQRTIFRKLKYMGANPLDTIIAGYKSRDFTLIQRVLTEFRIVFFYITLLLFPHPSRLNLTHNNLGMVFLSQGKAEEAKRYFAEAIQINPKFAMAHYNLGVALAKTGEFEDAVKHFSKATQLKPDHTVMCCALSGAAT